MSIKVLFLLMVLSSAAVVGVTLAAIVRVWWHLKSRRARSQGPAEEARPEEPGEHTPESPAERLK